MHQNPLRTQIYDSCSQKDNHDWFDGTKDLNMSYYESRGKYNSNYREKAILITVIRTKTKGHFHNSSNI